MHEHFVGKLDFPGNGIGNLLPFLVEKGGVDLELSRSLENDPGEGHELHPARIGWWMETLENPPQFVIFGQNILLDIMAAKK